MPSDVSLARPQARPATEGWQQQRDGEGRPLLQFASPRRGKPPVHLADLSIEERTARVVELGLPAFRAGQVARHYFTRWTSDPAEMTDLPAAGREEVVRGLLPSLMTETRRFTTDRGDTIKFLWRLHDGALVESVLMRYPGRITLCVSSQAGCGMNCPFCATGQAGLTRNLSAAEIVEQVVRANRVIAGGARGGRGGRGPAPAGGGAGGRPAGARRAPGAAGGAAARRPSASRTSCSWAWGSRSPTTPGWCRPCARWSRRSRTASR